MSHSIKNHTTTIFFFCVSSIIAFLWLATPANAYTNLTCAQRITGEHPKYQGITKTFTNVKLCTYTTGYTGNLASISADPEQGVVIPTKPEKVKDVYLYFSGKGGGSPEDNCVGSSDLCKKAEEQGNIAIVFFNRQEGKNRLLNTKESMTFFVDEAKQVLSELGVSATTYHLMGHSAGGEQVGFAAQFLSHMNFGYSIVFDGCYGEWCDNLIKYPNRGFSILYLNGTELTTANTVIDAKPTNIQIYNVPGITHELVPETCFNDHITQDGCGVSLESVYADGAFTGGNNSQASSKTIGTIQDELSELLESPTPRITIPGLSFSPDSVVEQSVQEDGGNFYVSIPYIGEYLSALYRFGVAAIVIIATIVLIYAGALWIISGGNGSQIEQAKADGRFDQAYDPPSTMQIPEDFLKKLQINPEANAFFATLNKTNLYAIAWRIQTAKREETRQKRIEEIIKKLEQRDAFHP